MLIIAGGSEDPSILRLGQAAAREGVEHRLLLVGPAAHPRIHWQLGEHAVRIDGERVIPRSLVLRYDVFSSIKDPRKQVSERAMSWYTTMTGYAYAHDEVRMFNKYPSAAMGNKPAILEKAARVGLPIPRTIVSNDMEEISKCQLAGAHIAKPVDGGGFCVGLEETLPMLAHHQGAAARPALVQNRLAQPEIRIYRIGDRHFTYRMDSPDLDYRVAQSAVVTPIETPVSLAAKLDRLMDELGMDFGAADFKSDPATGEFVFLELNSSPMIAHFDHVSEGALCSAMVLSLS